MRPNLLPFAIALPCLALSTPVLAQDAEGTQPVKLDNATSAPAKEKIVVEGIARKDGSIKDSPDAVDPINKAEIDSAVAEDLGDAIRAKPGVYLQRTAAGQASPIVRGMTGKQLLLTIDRLRFSNAAFRSGPNQYFASIDPFLIEDLEIIRGPYSVLYGSDALGGVVNVRTRSPRFYGEGGGFHPGFRTQYTSANRGTRHTIDLPFSTLDETLAGYATIGRGEYENIQGGRSIGEQPFTNFDEWFGSAGLTYRMNDKWNLDWRFSLNQKNDVYRTDKNTTLVIAPSKLPTNGSGDPISADILRIFPRQDDYFTSLRLSYGGSGRIESANISLYAHRVEEYVNRITNGSPDTLREQFFTDTTIGVRGEMVLDYGDASRVTLGADFSYDTISSGHDRVDLNTGVRTNRDEIAQFPDGSSYIAMGIFAQDEIWLNDGLFEIRPGLRFSGYYADAEVSKYDASLSDVSKFFGDVTASVAFAWHPNEWLTPSVQLARGFRAPNLDDLAANKNAGAGDEIPNPDLKPEQVIALQLGMRAHLEAEANEIAPHRLSASAFYFEHWLEDAAIRRPTTFNGNTVNQLMNAGRARMRGLEASAEYWFGGETLSSMGLSASEDALGVWGNFTYTRGDDLTNDLPFDRVPPMMGGLGVNYRFAGGKGYISPSMEFFGSQDRLSPTRASDPRFPVGESAGFTLFHLSAGWTPSDHFKVGMRVNNISNKDYHILGSGVLGTGTDFRLFTEVRW